MERTVWVMFFKMRERGINGKMLMREVKLRTWGRNSGVRKINLEMKVEKMALRELKGL